MPPHDTDVRATVLVRSERDVPNGVPWTDVVGGADDPLPDVTIDPDADAAIMYTSGTTGKPKGAVQTQRNCTNFLMQGAYVTMQMAAEAAKGAARTIATARAVPSRAWNRSLMMQV